MADFDIRKALPLLQSLGVSPERLGPEKLNEVTRMTEHLADPSQITPELAHKILETLGIKVGGQKKPTIKHTGKKIGRNEPCPCESGKKYKKCCGC